MLTVMICLVAAAFICTIVSALGRCPLWVAVLLLCVVEMIRVLPLGK